MSFEIAESDIPAFALGSGIISCGGGGNPYYGQLIARSVLAKTGPVKVIDVEEMEPGTLAASAGLIGAPLVGIEKPLSLAALNAGFKAVKALCRAPIRAFAAGEVGGMQSVMPLLLAAQSGLPVLDGDSMGRAFPEVQMSTFLIYGFSPGMPVALSDDHGLLWRIGVLPILKKKIGGTTRGGALLGVAIERLFRRYCAYKGGLIYITYTVDHRSLLRTLVRGSFRLALDLGRGVESARASGGDPVEAILRIAQGRLLFSGKIIDIERRFRQGHDWGKIQIQGMDADSGRHGEISFKNEYLIFRVGEEVVLTVPDLITMVERQTGVPITSDSVRAGLRVSVVGIQSSPLLRTPEALCIVGPNAFGYDLPYVPLFKDNRSPTE
jgi:DUF917 family protein